MRVLADAAHARAGDKGPDSIIVVAPFRAEDAQLVAATLEPGRLARHLGVAADAVEVVSEPRLGAFVVRIRGILDGGVTRSRSIDPHGKTLSGRLLEISLVSEGI